MLVAVAALLAAAVSARDFDALQEVVGHYAARSCARVTQKVLGEAATRTARMRAAIACDVLTDRLEHMVAVSGDDAMMQLYGRDEAGPRKRRGRSARRYYEEVIGLALRGAHHQQMLKILRKASEWAVGLAEPPTPEMVSARLQPEVGQWLINVASRSDPRVTSKEMRDEPEEELLD